MLMGEGIGGAPFFFRIKSPPALTEGDKSTALFPRNAVSGCQFVAGDVLCACLYVRHLKIIVDPDLWICMYIAVSVVL